MCIQLWLLRFYWRFRCSRHFSFMILSNNKDPWLLGNTTLVIVNFEQFSVSFFQNILSLRLNMSVWEQIIVILIAGIMAGILTPVIMRLINKKDKNRKWYFRFQEGPHRPVCLCSANLLLGPQSMSNSLSIPSIWAVFFLWWYFQKGRWYFLSKQYWLSARYKTKN